MHRLRAAETGDIEAMTDLLLRHGPNPWNHLPEEGGRAHLRAIADGEVRAVLAERDDWLLGFASFHRTEDFAHYQPQRADAPRAYICEAVVHPAAAGQGLGSALLEAVLAQLADEGIEDVYIDRHEENLASAGMMRKAGFVELETYADPARRPNGSGRSTVCHRNLSLQRRAVR
ncbi:GNAT family N-acetyltransferase [Pseudomonas aeruginosa]